MWITDVPTPPIISVVFRQTFSVDLPLMQSNMAEIYQHVD